MNKKFIPVFSCNQDLHKLYYCSKCQELKLITLKHEDSDIEKHIVCDKCQTELEAVEFNSSENIYDCKTPLNITPQIHCPKCKSINVDIYWTGFWD